MKWFIALLLMGLTSAFSVNTLTNFPSEMYGGGQYSASYHIDGDAIYPFFVFVNASDDINLVGCVKTGNWKCEVYSPDFNLTISLPSNISPGGYDLTVQFNGSYSVPDTPKPQAKPSSQSNGGGSTIIYGYVPLLTTNNSNITTVNATTNSSIPTIANNTTDKPVVQPAPVQKPKIEVTRPDAAIFDNSSQPQTASALFGGIPLIEICFPLVVVIFILLCVSIYMIRRE